MSAAEALLGAVVLVAVFMAPLLACIGLGRLVEYLDRRSSP